MGESGSTVAKGGSLRFSVAGDSEFLFLLDPLLLFLVCLLLVLLLLEQFDRIQLCLFWRAHRGHIIVHTEKFGLLRIHHELDCGGILQIIKLCEEGGDFIKKFFVRHARLSLFSVRKSIRGKRPTAVLKIVLFALAARP
ncbi:hypothetical protein RGU77_09595 [Actimicrobium sp. CCI2.3]|nr:hypothetical protein [Actimicrobium sp. CCI2.3]MDY7574535.1 hypothetical protein [Actimicrobium sp. CCI2.3]